MRVGIASDHGGFALKEQIADLLRGAAHEVLDFGADQPSPGDDYPDYVIPLARAVAAGTVDRGIALCGSGVGHLFAPTKLLVCAQGSSITSSQLTRALRTMT